MLDRVEGLSFIFIPEGSIEWFYIAERFLWEIIELENCFLYPRQRDNRSKIKYLSKKLWLKDFLSNLVNFKGNILWNCSLSLSLCNIYLVFSLFQNNLFGWMKFFVFQLIRMTKIFRCWTKLKNVEKTKEGRLKFIDPRGERRNLFEIRINRILDNILVSCHALQNNGDFLLATSYGLQ